MDIEKLIEQLRYLADTPSYTAFHDAKEREIICDQCEADFCYDKQQDAHWCMYEALSRAATALSTLQAENEKLRAEVESLKKGHCAGCSIPAVKAEQIRDLIDAPKLRAELEQVKRERDAAVSDIENALAYGLKDCELCVNVQCYVRGGTKPCLPKWRGPKKED